MIKVLKQGISESEKRELADQVKQTVEDILADIEDRGDEAVRMLSDRFDNWSPETFRLSDLSEPAAATDH